MKWLSLFLTYCFFSVTAWSESCPLPKTSFTKNIISADDRVVSLPGFGCLNDIELAGVLPISKTHLKAVNPRAATSNLFYWFIESKQDSPTTPIILWLNGGPGAASLYGLFIENGPYSVTQDGSLSQRSSSWTHYAHYLMIDQPAGVGFSFGAKNAFTDEKEAMDQLYIALSKFFDRYPELSSRPLFIAGESYAGKYIAQLAIRILASNDLTKVINLQGVLIGDGWINPKEQQGANAEYAYSHGLIDMPTFKKVSKEFQLCAEEIDKKTPSSPRANQVCQKMQMTIQKASQLNLVNIRTSAEPSDKAMTKYLNQKNVRTALHIDSRQGPFKVFDEKTAAILEEGEQDSVADLYAMLLDKGVRVLIYNGLDDAKDANFMGVDRWLSVFNWKKTALFSASSFCAWHVDKKVAGYVKTKEGLTQVKIRNAGHLAPVDQPFVVLDLVHRFITNKPYC